MNHHIDTLYETARHEREQSPIWDELRQAQANQLPRCVNHPGRAAPGVIPDGPVCEECGAMWVAETTLWRKAQGLIRGGYPR